MAKPTDAELVVLSARLAEAVQQVLGASGHECSSAIVLAKIGSTVVVANRGDLVEMGNVLEMAVLKIRDMISILNTDTPQKPN